MCGSGSIHGTAFLHAANASCSPAFPCHAGAALWEGQGAWDSPSLWKSVALGWMTLRRLVLSQVSSASLHVSAWCVASGMTRGFCHF